MKRVRQEVDNVAEKYSPDKAVPLKERLMKVPMEAWEFEFPDVDLCLREVIRLQLSGTALRRNTGPDLPINAVSKGHIIAVLQNSELEKLVEQDGRSMLIQFSTEWQRDHSQRHICRLSVGRRSL